MPFKDIALKPVYQSGIGNLLNDFYVPVISESVRYDRATGYFRSSILNFLGHTFMNFCGRSGKIRLVTGVEFTDEDIEQISKGYELRNIISKRLLDVVNEVSMNATPEILTLWWLIKNNYLDIKVSVTQDRNTGVQLGIYHEKFGIFRDTDNNKIVFAGSINESANGWMHNFESFDVFRDWIPGESERVKIREENFEALWENRAFGTQTYDFPDAVIQRIIELAPEHAPVFTSKSNALDINSVELRPYQQEAIDAWIANGYRGVLEMATGSGKTITSLFATLELMKRKPNVIIVILCPYTHLVDQWAEEASRVGFEPLKCYQSTASWKKKLIQKLADYKTGRINSFSIISTMDTASSENFLSLIKVVEDEILILADEMHNLGSNKRRRALLEAVPYRLGLSATPHRWMDEDGSHFLFDFFGEIVFKFSLSQAISHGFLTPYHYYPIPVEFTEGEWEEYEELTAKISKLMYTDNPDVKESLERLLLKRALIANAAQNKLGMLSDVIKSKSKIHHTLIYTSPQLLEEVSALVKEYNLYWAKFTAEESMTERRSILEMFASGQLDVLIAMKCLDEGVDVPSIHQAFVLASSSNPKEFIQRRGRILRKSPGKDHSLLYDFVVVPPHGIPISNASRGLVKKELSRFREFSETAVNSYQAKVKLLEIAKKYNVLGEL